VAVKSVGGIGGFNLTPATREASRKHKVFGADSSLSSIENDSLKLQNTFTVIKIINKAENG